MKLHIIPSSIASWMTVLGCSGGTLDPINTWKVPVASISVPPRVKQTEVFQVSVTSASIGKGSPTRLGISLGIGVGSRSVAIDAYRGQFSGSEYDTATSFTGFETQIATFSLSSTGSYTFISYNLFSRGNFSQFSNQNGIPDIATATILVE